eukprot:4605-Heterococcus_DN1.PRE.1
MIRRDAGVKPLSVRYTLEAAAAATGSNSSSSSSSSSKAGMFGSSAAKAQQQHHPDGRIIVLEYPSFDLLGCYAPNNGTDEKSFLRRREWDSAIQSWLTAQVTSNRRAGFLKLQAHQYCGSLLLKHTILYDEQLRGHSSALQQYTMHCDLNTTAARNDVSDPDWFSKQFCAAAAAGDRGQPGYTPNEQLRFNELVQAGQLVDVYRHFNPEGTDWTWRGGTGKYYR